MLGPPTVKANITRPSTLPSLYRLSLGLVFRFIFKLIRTVFLLLLGSAVAAKFLLESNAEPETEEIDLVAIFEGKDLVSVANPFYGGKLLTLFGGVNLDLRRVTPAPTGIGLDLMVVMGGVNLVVPEGWRVASELKLGAAGFSDNTRTTADDDVPTVTLTGFVCMGGVNVEAKSPVEAVS